MSGYHRRPDKLADPGPLLGRLRALRDDLIRASMTVKPFGVVHHALSMVIVAIDGLATVLTGEQYYLIGHGSTANGGARRGEAEKLARETDQTPMKG
jgi:hypothetical protein